MTWPCARDSIARMKSSIVIASFAMACCGCDSQAPTPSDASTATATASASAAPEPDKPEEKGVTILDKGKDPRALLRYAPKAGQAERLTLTNKTVQADVDGKERGAPSATIYLAFTFKEKKGDDLLYDIAVTKIDAKGDKEMPAAVERQLKATLGKVEGVKGTLLVSDRGMTREVKLAIGDDLPAEAKMAAGNLQETLAVLMVVLPTARVGEGAKWEVTSPVQQAGMTVDQTISYELAKNDAGRLTIKGTYKQTAKEQQMELAPGVMMKFLAHDATGTVAVDLDLAHLVPSKSESELKSKSTIQQGSRPKKDVSATTSIGLEGGIE